MGLQHAHVVHAVAHPDLVYDGAQHGGLHLGMDALGSEPVTRGGYRIDAYVQGGPGNHDAVERVLGAAHVGHDPCDLLRLLLQQRRVVPEDLDVDGLRLAAREVADVVFDELAEVGADRRLYLGNPAAQLVDDVVHGPAL